MKLHMLKNDLEILVNFKSNRQDRKYQIWKDRPLSIELRHDKIVEQKMNYLHNNPIQAKWKLAEKPEDYKYSSWGFYVYGKSEYDFLTNFYLA
jgi:putative transposase